MLIKSTVATQVAGLTVSGGCRACAPPSWAPPAMAEERYSPRQVVVQVRPLNSGELE